MLIVFSWYPSSVTVPLIFLSCVGKKRNSASTSSCTVLFTYRLWTRLLQSSMDLLGLCSLLGIEVETRWPGDPIEVENEEGNQVNKPYQNLILLRGCLRWKTQDTGGGRRVEGSYVTFLRWDNLIYEDNNYNQIFMLRLLQKSVRDHLGPWPTTKWVWGRKWLYKPEIDFHGALLVAIAFRGESRLFLDMPYLLFITFSQRMLSSLKISIPFTQ